MSMREVVPGIQVNEEVESLLPGLPEPLPQVEQLLPQEQQPIDVSQRLLTVVAGIAKETGQPYAILGQDDFVEGFQMGDEVAHLRKITHFEDDYRKYYEGCVESYQYRKFGWWRRVIDTMERSGISLTLLDTPVIIAAEDAGIEDAASLFQPRGVVARYGLSPGGDTASFERQRGAVRERIIQVVNELIVPQGDYQAVHYMDWLRLGAVSADAIASRQAENDAYQRVQQGLRAAAMYLPFEFQSMVPR